MELSYKNRDIKLVVTVIISIHIHVDINRIRYSSNYDCSLHTPKGGGKVELNPTYSVRRFCMVPLSSYCRNVFYSKSQRQCDCWVGACHGTMYDNNSGARNNSRGAIALISI